MSFPILRIKLKLLRPCQKQFNKYFRSLSLYKSSLPDRYYNKEQKEIQSAAGKIIETEIKPFEEKWDAEEESPSHALIKKFGNAGLLGIRFDPKYGGLGLNYKYQAAYLEEMGTLSCGGVAAGIVGHTEITLPALARFGSEELKKQFLSPSIAGDVVSCLGVSGISKSKILKIGWNASDTAHLFFEDVRVPVRNIIGEEGNGFLYQMLQFQEERLGLVLSSLRTLDRALNDTIEYTERRQVFGKSILDNQVVHFRLAELATEVEALRALTYKAVDMMVNGEDVTRLASMAKLKVGRLLRTVPDACLQFWGGVGYKRDSFISRLYRDGRLASIGGGADEIMMEIIIKLMGIAPAPVKRVGK